MHTGWQAASGTRRNYDVPENRGYMIESPEVPVVGVLVFWGCEAVGKRQLGRSPRGTIDLSPAIYR